MEDTILGYIAEAERRAAEMKSQAQEQAANLIAAAEQTAVEIARASEADCAAFREKSQKDAQMKATAEYDKTISESRAEAKKYADSLLENASTHVSGIVRRLTK